MRCTNAVALVYARFSLTRYLLLHEADILVSQKAGILKMSGSLRSCIDNDFAISFFGRRWR